MVSVLVMSGDSESSAGEHPDKTKFTKTPNRNSNQKQDCRQAHDEYTLRTPNNDLTKREECDESL